MEDLAPGLEEGLKQERNHQDYDWSVVQGLNCFIKTLPNNGMDKLFEPVPFVGIVEHDRGQARAVDR